MISSEIIHCLKPLEIVKIEQRYFVFAIKILSILNKNTNTGPADRLFPLIRHGVGHKAAA